MQRFITQKISLHFDGKFEPPKKWWQLSIEISSTCVGITATTTKGNYLHHECDFHSNFRFVWNFHDKERGNLKWVWVSPWVAPNGTFDHHPEHQKGLKFFQHTSS